MKSIRTIISILAVLLFLTSTSLIADAITLDFEPSWPSGVNATSPFDQGTALNSGSIITNQYSNTEIVMNNVTLVDFFHPSYYARDPILYPLGSSAYSGRYGISPISSSNQLDYTGSMTFEFFNGSTSAVTDYFSIATDRDGSSYNSVTLYAYDLSNNLLGSTTWTEIGNGGTILVLSGIGNFHKVIVQENNSMGGNGGIAFDYVTFNPPIVPSSGPSTPVGYSPEWLLITLVSLTLAGGYLLRRRGGI